MMEVQLVFLLVNWIIRKGIFMNKIISLQQTPFQEVKQQNWISTISIQFCSSIGSMVSIALCV